MLHVYVLTSLANIVFNHHSPWFSLFVINCTEKLSCRLYQFQFHLLYLFFLHKSSLIQECGTTCPVATVSNIPVFAFIHCHWRSIVVRLLVHCHHTFSSFMLLCFSLFIWTQHVMAFIYKGFHWKTTLQKVTLF